MTTDQIIKNLATKETINIMKIRYQDNLLETSQKISYGEYVNIHGVKIKFIPAGHILGSAQISLEYKGEKIVVSGDYKRRYDQTCQPFEINKCNISLQKLHLHYLFLSILMINLRQKK